MSDKVYYRLFLIGVFFALFGILLSLVFSSYRDWFVTLLILGLVIMALSVIFGLKYFIGLIFSFVDWIIYKFRDDDTERPPEV
jgi:hypothetical protein